MPDMESTAEFEELLATLARSTATLSADLTREELSAPAAETLTAYREGRLSVSETTALERLLSRSRDARVKLSELSSNAPPAPGPELRDRALEGFEAAFEGMSWSSRATRRGADRISSERRRSRRCPRTWGLAAAAAAAAAGALLLFQAPVPLPENLDYEMVVRGLAQERGAEPDLAMSADFDAGSPVRAYSDTVIRITASPVGEALSGVEFGLYRWRSDGLVRFDGGVDFESSRGAARLGARAGDLVGAGREGFAFLVVARAGDLPRRFSASGLEDARHALESDGRRKVYPFEIRILDPGDDPDIND